MKSVLVTRPAHQNQALIQALEQQGLQVFDLPMLEIAPFTMIEHAQACQAIEEKVKALGQYDHVVFVSTNAVQHAFTWINKLAISLPAHTRWYPIGTATANALAEYVPVVEQAGVDMDSETLLENPYLQTLTGQKVLIFRGQGGRAFLKEQLTLRGAQVDFCELYQRKFIRYADAALARFLAGKLDFLIANSTETIQAVLEQAIIDKVLPLLLNVGLIVPGVRVAQFAKAQGFSHVIVSRNAGLKATVQAVQQEI